METTLPPAAPDTAALDLRRCDPRLWFAWALKQFPSLDVRVCPDPTRYTDVGNWVRPFDKWACSHLSDIERNCAGFILGFYNSATRWKCVSRDFHAAFAAMDNVNRRAVTTILTHARYF